MKTKLLKTLAFATLLWMPFTQASADSGFLTLWLKSGNSLQVSLDNQPKMTFNGTTIHLSTTENDEEFSFEFSDVAYFTLDDKELANDVTATQTSRKRVTLKKCVGGFTIEDAEGDVIIKVAALNGSIIQTLQTDGNGSATIDLSNEPHGIYIIKVGIIPFVVIK